MLRHQPPWRKDHKVHNGLPWVVGLARQDSENTRIWMIIADRAYGVEKSQIVFEGCVVTVPGHHVKGTVVLLVLEEAA